MHCSIFLLLVWFFIIYLVYEKGHKGAWHIFVPTAAAVVLKCGRLRRPPSHLRCSPFATLRALTSATHSPYRTPAGVRRVPRLRRSMICQTQAKSYMNCLHIILSYLIDSPSHNPLNILPYIHSLWSSRFIKYECLIRHYYRNCLISHILYSLKNDIINHWRHDWFLIIFNELSDYLCLHT